MAAWKARADAWRGLGRPNEVLYSLKAILLLEPGRPAVPSREVPSPQGIGRDEGRVRIAVTTSRNPCPEAQGPRPCTWRRATSRPTWASPTRPTSPTSGPPNRPRPAVGDKAIHGPAFGSGRVDPDLALEVLEEGKTAAEGTPTPAGLLLLRAKS